MDVEIEGKWRERERKNEMDRKAEMDRNISELILKKRYEMDSKMGEETVLSIISSWVVKEGNGSVMERKWIGK